MFPDKSNEVAQRYFAFEKSHVPGVAVSLWGSPYKNKSSNTHLKHALIPDGTPTFEFNTFFRGWQAGHYVVRWRVKLKGNFSIPGGLHFRVDVNYGSEGDATSSLDVVMPHSELEKPDSLDKECTYDLELGDLVVVQPQPNGGRAMVVVTMSNFESADATHSGLQVEYVELSPFSGFNQSAEKGVFKHVVRSTTEPKFTIRLMELPVFNGGTSPTTQSAISIARLAWSKDSTVLAALALWNNTAYIFAWDMKQWDPSKPKDTSILQKNCAVTTIKQMGNDLKNLSIGLAISADGNQIAVYQEPMVGHWADGSTSIDSTFQFRLLIREQDISEPKDDTPAQNQDVLVEIDQSKGPSNADMVPTANEPSVLNSRPGSHPPRNNNSSTTTAPQVLEPQKQTNQVYKEVDPPHHMLKNFVGYGAFLNEARNRDRDMTDPSVTQTVNEGVKVVDNGEQDINDKITFSDRIKRPKQPAPSNMLFVACNGIYLDILKIKPEKVWVHTHSIRITDLTPTISRRITCKMMMDTISRNTFMWLEDGGACCMLWDLQKGSNISYLSSSDNAKLAGPTFYGNNTMSISPDESMVALANVDGVLTTFYANTGLAIDTKKFQDYQIEYVAFNGQNNQLFVIVRHITTLKLESWILDPLRLNSGIKACGAPVPIIGRTIHASFRDESFRSKGLVCKANGGEIHCHITHESVINTVDRIEDNIVATVTYYPLVNSGLHPETKGDQKAETKGDHKTGTKAGGRHDYKAGTKGSPKAKAENVHATVAGNEHIPPEQPMACKQYEVRTATDKLSRDEDDSSYWVLRVDVVERTDLQKEKVIFSFVPEPWMHISAKVRHPEEYQKVYFMPGGRRFVVVGIQTLQIWSFSSNGNNNNFNLVFFWSRPNVGTDLVPNGQTATDSERSDKESSPYLKKPRIEAVANLEKPDAQPSTDPEKPQSETSGNPSDSGKIKGAIETELVGEYYHYIHNLHIHLDEKTEEAEAHIRLKRRRGTDIVSIPSEHSRDIHIIFLHCAQSIHLLAAAYTFSVQESKKFPNNLEKPLTFIEHAEAIVRFTQGHINRLLLRKHLHPKLTELDMPIHTKSGQASAQAPKKPRAEASVQALEKAPAKAPEQKPEKTPEKATEQAKAPEQAEAPEQAKAPKRGINDPPPSPKRHPSMPQGSPVPPGKVLMVLECGPPTDQKSQVTPHGSPISSTSATEDPRKKGIISFVIDTVDTQKEKFLAQKDEDASSEDIFTVLTLLLDQNDLNDANHIFIEGLFTSTSHEWVPHPSVALNPIDRMIDIGNERLLAIMINYCINNAKTHHPGYLTPVIQCLSELSLWYPDIVSDLFRKASYIPAHNPAYVASNAIIANPNLSDWIHFLARFYTFGIFNRGLFGFTNSSDINNYKAPIFSIRSQLPFYSHTGLNVILDLILSRRVSYFTYRKNTGKSPPTVEDQERRIYVSPFQFKPINGRDGRRDGSYLALVAGRDLSDTPAVVATVQYKWFTIGLYFWSIRFMVLLLFFILVVIITAQQIRVSSPPSDHDPTADEISARYLPGWQPVFIVTIAVGFLLIIYELFQVKYSPGKYFRSPYNYVDLAACLFPVVGCFLFLQVSPGTIREDTGIDGGPSQIWIMGFGILLLYLNLLFELRIFKQLGVAVNIIFNISRRIKWFLLIFVVILVSFTHVLLYLLHTRRYRTCKDGSCDDIDYPSNYPTGFFKALLVTYFFMSGRYDPVDTSLDKGSVGFQLVMVIFYFFTAILLLNVLIALMNDAFDESKMEGEIAHWKLVCEVLIEVETQAIFKPIVDDYDPGYIYYCASDEEVKKFQSGSEISIFADSSRAAHKQTQGMIIESLSEVKDTNVRTKVEIKDFVEGTLKKEFADLREDLKRRRDHDDSMQVSAKLGETAGRRRGHDGLRQELAEPRALVEHPPGHNELKQELAELRGLVERPPSHDDLKQELAELRELVERPPGHDELKKELSALKGLVESLVLQLRSNNTAT